MEIFRDLSEREAFHEKAVVFGNLVLNQAINDRDLLAELAFPLIFSSQR